MAKKKPKLPPWAAAVNPKKAAREAPIDRARSQFLAAFEGFAQDARSSRFPPSTPVRVHALDPSDPSRRRTYAVALRHDHRGVPDRLSVVQGPRAEALLTMSLFAPLETTPDWEELYEGHTMADFDLIEPSDKRPHERTHEIGHPPLGRKHLTGLLYSNHLTLGARTVFDADAIGRLIAVLEVLRASLEQELPQVPLVGPDAQLLELQPDGSGQLIPPFSMEPLEREILAEVLTEVGAEPLDEEQEADWKHRLACLPITKGDSLTFICNATMVSLPMPIILWSNITLAETRTLETMAQIGISRTTEPDEAWIAPDEFAGLVVDLLEQCGKVPEELIVEATPNAHVFQALLDLRTPGPGEPCPYVRLEPYTTSAMRVMQWKEGTVVVMPEGRALYEFETAFAWLQHMGRRVANVTALSLASFAAAQDSGTLPLPDEEYEERALDGLILLSAFQETGVVAPWYTEVVDRVPEDLEPMMQAWSKVQADLCTWSPKSPVTAPRFRSLISGATGLELRDLPHYWSPSEADTFLVFSAEYAGQTLRRPIAPLPRSKAEALLQRLGKPTQEKLQATTQPWLQSALNG